MVGFLYISQRKDGKFNLLESEGHVCLSSGIEFDDLEERIGYFVSKYRTKRTILSKLSKFYSSKVSKSTLANRIESYSPNNDYQEYIDEIVKEVMSENKKSQPVINNSKSFSSLKKVLKAVSKEPKEKKIEESKPHMTAKPVTKVSLRDKFSKIRTVTSL